MKNLRDVIIWGNYFETSLQRWYANKWFIVTGASSGIGELIAKGLLALNANVIAVARWWKKDSSGEYVSTLDAWRAEICNEIEIGRAHV